ncbi:uncharacterized protein LOC132601550 [Lycium barbarum]|uniref:uncharacterized protein LOC132601550 n=1 Tax=Lycium barbarum TaxID=112863 RepID=UPI00293E1751|nr:uncharacterized protein LOC132601550 [Lycium barbarum]
MAPSPKFRRHQALCLAIVVFYRRYEAIGTSKKGGGSKPARGRGRGRDDITTRLRDESADEESEEEEYSSESESSNARSGIDGSGNEGSGNEGSSNKGSGNDGSNNEGSGAERSVTVSRSDNEQVWATDAGSKPDDSSARSRESKAKGDSSDDSAMGHSRAELRSKKM